MRTTSKLNVVSIRLATCGEWHDVMKLEKGGLATSPVRPVEAALAGIASPDDAPHRGWHVTTLRRAIALMLRSGGLRGLLTLDLFEQ